MKKSLALLNPHLEAFMAVAKYKSVHRGARAIHISQTAMTQRIHSLEQKIKTTLFIRTRQGMQLTCEGQKLLRYCHIVADFSHETLSDMMNAGIDIIQRVKISGTSSIMSSRIIPTGMKIMKRFPQLFISFDVNDTDHAVEMVRTGQSQFAVLEPEKIAGDMETKVLAPEKYLLVCSKQWKGRKLTDILQTERIIDFDESDQMSHNYLKQFNLLQYAQPDRLFVNRNDSLAKMLIEGFGYGVLTKEFSKPYLQNGELIALNNAQTYDYVLKLAWFNRPEPPKYFLAIIDAMT